MLTRIRKDIEGSADKAFTLIELIVVIIIIGVLAGATVPAYNSILSSSRNKALQATAASFEKDYLGVAARDEDLGAIDPRWYSTSFAPNSGMAAMTSVALELANKGLKVTAIDITKTITPSTSQVVYDYTTSVLTTSTVASLPTSGTFYGSTTTAPTRGAAPVAGTVAYLQVEKGSVAGCLVLSGAQTSGMATRPLTTATLPANLPTVGTIAGGWFTGTCV